MAAEGEAVAVAAQALEADGAPARVPEVVPVEVGGVEVQVNLSYVKSWEGVMQAKRMQSGELSNADRFWAMVDYYDRVCPNAADVAQALGGEAVGIGEVFGTIGKAVKAATPKN